MVLYEISFRIVESEPNYVGSLDGWHTCCLGTVKPFLNLQSLGLFSVLTNFPYYRLYSKGRVLGHKRAKRNSRPNTTLLQIEGVATKEDARFYLGKVLMC